LRYRRGFLRRREFGLDLVEEGYDMLAHPCAKLGIGLDRILAVGVLDISGTLLV
jgi:hypothetical protein